MHGLFRKRQNRNRDWSVLLLTSTFSAVAILVFAFALWHHRHAKSVIRPQTHLVPDQAKKSSSAGQFRCVRVVDGDTLIITGFDEIDLAVRLRGIDAPELEQPYGVEAKEELQRLVESAKLRLDKPSKEKYGRYLANVFADRLWINKVLVENGCAWCDPVYSRDSEMYNAESAAKQNRKGLWANGEAIAPWIWRSEHR